MGRDLAELASYVRPLVEELIQQAIDAGLDPVVEDTGRTMSEQEAKLQQGVSKTKHSRHLPQPPEFKSEAVDIVPGACIKLKYWGWYGTVEASHEHWGRLIDLGVSLGLDNGYRMWGWDPGHFQFKRS